MWKTYNYNRSVMGEICDFFEGGPFRMWPMAIMRLVDIWGWRNIERNRMQFCPQCMWHEWNMKTIFFFFVRCDALRCADDASWLLSVRVHGKRAGERRVATVAGEQERIAQF